VAAADFTLDSWADEPRQAADRPIAADACWWMTGSAERGFRRRTLADLSRLCTLF
jgi:hypothetical protein